MRQQTAARQTRRTTPRLTSAIGVAGLLMGALLVASFPTVAGIATVSTAAVVAAALVGAAIERTRTRTAERHSADSPGLLDAR